MNKAAQIAPRGCAHSQACPVWGALLMKKLKALAAIACLGIVTLTGCATWPYHTSESSLAEQILLPSELDALTRRYEQKGMSYWDARRRAYSEIDSGERGFYRKDREKLRSREITAEDIRRATETP
jgi:hypothetical protein